jgi:transposase
MLTPRPAQQIFLAVEPVDTRGGFDRLAGRVLHAGLDLYAGHLFVFVSRRREHLKNLTWDGSGLLILYKRLSKGRFALPDVDRAARTATLDAATLAALLDGIGVDDVRRSKSAPAPRRPIDKAPAS